MAVPTETIRVADYAAYLKRRSMVFHADRSSAKFQISYSAPMRKWIRASRTGPDSIKIEYFDVCPCSLGG